jgi:two-component system, OmpR family, alkaline phosphatase synthesis response regulator PhoP
MNPKILIVDDEEDIVELLKYNLEQEEYEVKFAYDGVSGIKIAESFDPHMIILDVMMPGLDGIEVCEKLRSKEQHKETIICFLTARSETFTQLAALDKGGDDYIQKPVKINIFIAKVRALLRRHKLLAKESTNKELITIGELVIDIDHYLVKFGKDEIYLAKKEFELLSLLASKVGRVFKREEILQNVWGGDVIVGDRTIDVHIRKLREKIGDDYFHTVKGVGYKLDTK